MDCIKDCVDSFCYVGFSDEVSITSSNIRLTDIFRTVCACCCKRPIHIAYSSGETSSLIVSLTVFSSPSNPDLPISCSNVSASLLGPIKARSWSKPGISLGKLRSGQVSLKIAWRSFMVYTPPIAKIRWLSTLGRIKQAMCSRATPSTLV